MAYITKLTDKPRKKRWLARIRRKGQKELIKMFATRKEAELWAGEQERSLWQTGLPTSFERLKNHTVGEIAKRYLDEITPTKKSHARERSTLKTLLTRDICKRSLAHVDEQDARDYEKARLKETFRGRAITPRTVRREINFIQRIFEVARTDWGYKNLQNPFRGMRIIGSKHERERRLRDGELLRLEKACEECHGRNKYYVKLAIRLAVLTGMRLQEIFNLVWDDISIERGEIHIRKSKTDDKQKRPGRDIALPFSVEMLLLRLAYFFVENDAFDPSDRIFPMTKGAFSQAWLTVVARAGIKDLHFHDLRHEAASLFADAGLREEETALMLGHKDKRNPTTAAYVHLNLKRIRQMLNRHTTSGSLFAMYGQELPLQQQRQAQTDDQDEIDKFEADYRKGTSIEQAARLLQEHLAEEERQQDERKRWQAKQKELIEMARLMPVDFARPRKLISYRRTPPVAS